MYYYLFSGMMMGLGKRSYPWLAAENDGLNYFNDY